jgi:hypothetical protein
MGGAADSYVFGLFGGGSERDLFTREARDAFPGAWIYNDVTEATGFADVVAAFPAGSVSQLVIGGHGTWDYRVGVQPTNNNTEVPSGYDYLDSWTLPDLPQAKMEGIQAAMAPGALVQIYACGGENIEPRKQAGQALANLFRSHVRYAVGSVIGWNAGTPGSEKENGKLIVGEWVDKWPIP